MKVFMPPPQGSLTTVAPPPSPAGRESLVDRMANDPYRLSIYDDLYDIDEQLDLLCFEEYDDATDDLSDIEEIDENIDTYSDVEPVSLYSSDTPDPRVRNEFPPAPYFDPLQSLHNRRSEPHLARQQNPDELNVQAGLLEAASNVLSIPGDISQAARFIASSSQSMGVAADNIALTSGQINDFINEIKTIPNKVGKCVIKKTQTVIRHFNKIISLLLELNFPGAVGTAITSTATLLRYCVTIGFEYHREILFVCVGIGALCIMRSGASFFSAALQTFFNTISTVCEGLLDIGASIMGTCYTKFRTVCLNHSLEIPTHADNDIKVQSATANWKNLRALIGFVTALSLGTRELSTKNVLDAMGSASRVLPVLDGVNNLATILIEHLPESISSFLKRTFGMCDDSAFSKVFREQLVVANKLLFRYDQEGTTSMCDTNYCQEIVHMHANLVANQHKELSHLTSGSASRYIITDTIRRLSLIVPQARNSALSNGKSFEKLGIHISGPPGVGKSLVSTSIGEVLGAHYPEGRRIYHSSIADSFESGYNGHFCFTVDDANMSDGENAKEANYQTIALINPVPCRLNMADITNKGLIFNSKLIVHTSNYALNQPLAGIKPESYPAYYRRFNNMALHCTLNPGFANECGNLDVPKLLARPDASSFPHLRFDRYRVIGGVQVPMEQGLTYHDVLLLAKGYLYKFANLADKFSDLCEKQVIEAKTLFSDFDKLRDVMPNKSVNTYQQYRDDSVSTTSSEYSTCDEHKEDIKMQGRSVNQILAEEKPPEPPEPEEEHVLVDKSGMCLRKLCYGFGEGKNAELYNRIKEDCLATGELGVDGIKLLKVHCKDETMTDRQVSEIWRDEVLLEWFTILDLVENKRDNLSDDEVVSLFRQGLLTYATVLQWARSGVLCHKEGMKHFTFCMSISEDMYRVSELDPSLIEELLVEIGEVWFYRTAGDLCYFVPDRDWWHKDVLAVAEVRCHAGDFYDPPDIPELALHNRFLDWVTLKKNYLFRYMKEHFPAANSTTMRILKVIGVVGTVVAVSAAIFGVSNRAAVAIFGSTEPKVSPVQLEDPKEPDQELEEGVLEMQSNTKSSKINRSHRARRMVRLDRNKIKMNNALHAGLLPSDDNEDLSCDDPRSDSQESGYEFDDKRARSGLYTNVKQAIVLLERDGSFLTGFVAKGSLMVTTSHFFRDYKDGFFTVPDEGSLFHATIRGKRIEIPFRKANLDMWESDGLTHETCVYDLGGFISPSKDITKYFVSEDEMAQCAAENLYIVQLEKGSPKISPLGHCILVRERKTFVSSLGSFGEHHNGYVPKSFVYPKGLADGTCGCLIIRKTKFVTKIVGMHYASTYSGSAGFAVPIDRVEIDRLLEGRKTVVNSGPLPYAIVQDCSPIPAHEDLTSVGRLSGKVNPPPHKTRFVESIFLKAIPEKLCDVDNKPGPSIISENDPRLGDWGFDDVINQELAKLHSTPVLDDVTWQQVVRGQTDKLMTYKTAQSRVLSIMEAINSSELLPNVKPIPRSTSAGYPMAELKPKGILAGKGHIFGDRDGGGFDIIDDAYAKFLGVCVERIEKGHDLKSISTVVPKDEIRPFSKLKDRKTRVIHAGALHVLILYRMYFGDFINTLRKKFPTGSCAIGMNVYSPDWDEMVKRMLRVGDKFGDSDYSGFEGYVNTQAYESFLTQADAFYDDLPEPARSRSILARKVIIADIQHGLFRWKRDVFQKHSSMTSGSGLTADLNSLANEAFFMFSFITAMERVPEMVRFATPFSFYRQTALAILGDDNIISISNRVAPYYDMKIHQGIMAEYGIVVTAANKKDEIMDGHKTLKEIEFLKGTVVQSDEIPGVNYMHYADEESIKKSLMYVNGNLDHLEASHVNANMALMRLFTSGPVRFASWRATLSGTLKEYGCSQPLIGYDDCKKLFLKHCLDPLDYLYDGDAVVCNIDMQPTMFFL